MARLRTDPSDRSGSDRELASTAAQEVVVEWRRWLSGRRSDAAAKGGAGRESQRRLYRRAERLVRKGRPDRAAAILSEELDRAPRAAQIVYLFGAALALDGRPREAAPVLARAYDLKPWLRELPAEVADLRQAAGDMLDQVPDSVWARYELERTRWAGMGMTLERAVQSALASSDTTAVQVGANDGRRGDPIHDFIARYGWRGVLLEPIPAAFDALRRTYEGRDDLVLVNAAIAEETSEAEMYIDPDRPTTYATLEPDRNDLRSSDELETVEVRTRTFSDVFDEHGTDRVDLLQIDTEGADLRVLGSFPFERFHPLVINMEFNLLTLEERLEAFHLLSQHGYAWRYPHDRRDLLALDVTTFRREMCLVDRGAG